MINWTHEEDAFCEGRFKSKFFRDEDGGDELDIGIKSSELRDCAEKCVEAFNSLTEAQIEEICRGLIKNLREEGLDEELPKLKKPLDILKHCWFSTLYVNMLHKDDKVAYVVEGYGEWDEQFGFAVENGKVVYVGVDYFDYMKDE